TRDCFFSAAKKVLYKVSCSSAVNKFLNSISNSGIVSLLNTYYLKFKMDCKVNRFKTLSKLRRYGKIKCVSSGKNTPDVQGESMKGTPWNAILKVIRNAAESVPHNNKN